jgi:hypothetical protein
MTAIPLARFLVDFGTDGDRNTDGVRGEASLIASANARVAESHARGHAEGRAAAETEFAAKLEAQQQDFERRLVMARQDWAATEGKALSEALVRAMGDLEERLAETTARVLQPFLETEIRRAAVTELVAAIESILAHGKAAQVEITGPDDLLDVVRARLPDKAPATFTSSQTGDIRVAIDQTVLETRLGAWTAAIEEAVR